MELKRPLAALLAFLVALTPTSTAWADPCGMVPPIYLGQGPPIARIGVQKTFVFHKDGIESIVIRPGFSGKVDEFGMLIPFPSPPAIRKVADDVFAHVAAAIDPPEVVVDLRMRYLGCGDMARAAEPALGYYATGKRAAEQEVVVLREEAVGMYEVAVLEAGSAAALERWMDEHGFRYPKGMDAPCEDYVDRGWCFVAVKARVGQKSGSRPRPGMRSAETALPAGSSFDGHVQAMGFRFRSEELVVPMRLSAFNEGDLRNVVYVLSDGPKRIERISTDLVTRQLPGHVLYRHLTEPLPLRILGGDLDDVPEWRRANLPAERDPAPHNGIARDLFASDLLAVRHDRLAHPHEETEKELLEIGERLGLRGPELDALHRAALVEERERVVDEALAGLAGMTLTVIDGDFPREVLAADDLAFVAFHMTDRRNRPDLYDAKFLGPPPAPPVLGGFLESGERTRFARVLVAAAALLAAAFLASRVQRHRRETGRRAAGATLACLAIAGLLAASPVGFAHAPRRDSPPVPPVPRDPGDPGDPDELDAAAVEALLVQDAATIGRLVAEARDGASIASRGWAIVALAELGGDDARRGLEVLDRSTGSALVRTWAAAARVGLAQGPGELAPLTGHADELPAVLRPLSRRWLELLADPREPVPLGVVLDAASRSHALQQEVLPTLLAGDTAPFVDVMLTDRTTQARNLAAGCLATLASQGRDGISASVLSALRFDADATRLPWDGGPLFLPSVAWTAEESLLLMRQLVAWHLYCDLHGLRDAQSQIHNNLRGWSLANALGYAMPSRELSTRRWLLVFGDVAGREALRALLEEQGVARDRVYRSLLVLVDDRELDR